MNKNRTVQIDMSNEDMDILLGINLPVEPRKHDRQDAAIMHLRTTAHGRGATPAEIERNVLALEDL